MTVIAWLASSCNSTIEAAEAREAATADYKYTNSTRCLSSHFVFQGGHWANYLILTPIFKTNIEVFCLVYKRFYFAFYMVLTTMVR